MLNGLYRPTLLVPFLFVLQLHLLHFKIICLIGSIVLNEQVIGLSAATQEYLDSIICNAHGADPRFLEKGKD